MSNHPNRGRAKAASTPSPETIRALRVSVGHTQKQAAHLIHATERAWQAWEQGERPMHAGLFELYQIKTGRLNDSGMA